MTPWITALLTWLGTLVGQADADAECLVLGGLDVARAHAFALDDPALLVDVYADGALRKADADVMTTYRDRGFTLGGVGTERLSCRAVKRTDERLELDVVDRLAGSWAEQDGERLSLPTDEPTRRTVVLVSTDDGWRIDEVS